MCGVVDGSSGACVCAFVEGPWGFGGGEPKQHRGPRNWLIPPHSCLASGPPWEEGWMSATAGVLLVLWVCLGKKAVWRRDQAEVARI